MLGNLHVRFGVGAGVKSPGPHHFILAQGGATYARLRFGTGPGGQLRVPIDIDFGREFSGSDYAAWDQEYQQNVRVPPPELPRVELLGEPRFERRPWDELDEREFMQWEDPFYFQEVR